jgi:protein O-mannosyl-transferase
MLNKSNISDGKKKFIIYIILALATLAVYWQVNHFGFVNYDDPIYVTENSHIKNGISREGFCWAFSTIYAEFWHPVTWLSLMLDYQLYGPNAGGYHLTNLILHILSTLLLFWLFNRMTGAVWKSAFVAAVFALHPLHVESVAWIAERKDVLSTFFWMLTLCLYVYYTEKPLTKRYLLVILGFISGLLSKPMNLHATGDYDFAGLLTSPTF